MAKWMKLEPGTMPPVRNDKRFLLIRGTDPDDRILCVAARVQYDGKDPYIRYIGGENGWRILPEEEYGECLWEDVAYPDED